MPINVNDKELIEFSNLVNECCAVMDHDYVAEWLQKKHPDLNMERPIDRFRSGGSKSVYRLLYFIEKDEADL
ncbi:MAG: hypothetical protein CMN79_03605 [Spirochaetales bacterium]|jgi:phage regulator Rha-like protein|nr:hypothetical protein [Spirochaetales bacterium]